MVTSTTRNMIQKLQECLINQPVNKAWLFGSCSRGEERPESDVDILVEYDKSKRISLMTISKVMCSLSDAIGRQVDLIEDGHLMPFAIDSANRDKILIYERENQR